MKIELKKINIRELSKNYIDNIEEGVDPDERDLG